MNDIRIIKYNKFIAELKELFIKHQMAIEGIGDVYTVFHTEYAYKDLSLEEWVDEAIEVID